jgi:MFS family permease
MNLNSPGFKRAARTSTVLFFFFMLLHQTDKLLIGPLQPQVMDTFNMTYTQWGMINTGALLVGALLYPVWGWLNDHYNRGKLLALASLLWGSTTWLSAIVRTFPAFLVTRSSTGIDDSSYPGMMSLLADYYPPKSRGKLVGILQLTQPLGYLLGMVLALMLGGVIGWRNVFFITGSLGIVLAVAIFFGVKDVPRGSSETELQGVEVSKYKFNWQSVREIFSKRSLYFVFAQGFIGVFPWNVITYYFFGYLATDRGYDSNTQLMIMAPAVLVMALGYPLGGVLGDRLFKKTKRGRLIVSAVGILLGMVFLTITMNVAQPQVGLFTAMLLLTALFMPFSSPNIVPTIFDVTLPEVRSTANAVQNFIEYIGSASAPLIAGIIADRFSVGTAILSISLITWALCFLLILVAIVMIPKDINAMHAQLEARAAAEKAG